MSEMQKLKEETERQYVKQRLDEIGKYIEELADECHARFLYTMRCDILETICFVAYWAVLVMIIFLDVPQWVRDNATGMMFLVWLVAIFRGWYHNKRWREKEGEWEGATRVLKILGMMKEMPPAPPRKKHEWHPFAGLVETWERLKQKAQGTVWKPA